MDAVNEPALGSNVIAGANAVELSNLDVRVQVARRYQPLVAVTLAVASGIVWDRYGPRDVFTHGVDFAFGSSAFLFCCSACASCLGVWWLAWRRRRDGVASWVLLAAVAFAGSAWHELNWFLFDRYEIARYAEYEPAPVCLEAIAGQSPERVAAPQATPLRAIPAGERSRLLVELTGVRDGQQWQPARGMCQLSVDGHLLGVHPGDRLRVFGHIARISPTQNPGEFDFAAHARADRQLVRVRSTFPECVTTLAHSGSWDPSRLIDAIRAHASNSFARSSDRTEPRLQRPFCWGLAKDFPTTRPRPTC